MPLFVYRGSDGPGGAALRKTDVRERHLAHIQALVDAGRIHYAGPLLDEAGDPCGSLILFEAEDHAAARRVADSDPYRLEGVFERIEVWGSRQVKP